MPILNTVLSQPLRDALFDCFRQLVTLVQPEKRHSVVLVGGAASVAHASSFKTEDVDVAVPEDVAIEIWHAAAAGTANFAMDSDSRIVFQAPDFRLYMDILELGGGIVEKIHTADPLFEGGVASIEDLLLLRALSVVDRESDDDVCDFRWLAMPVAGLPSRLPELTPDESEILSEAAKLCFGELGLLITAALLGPANEAASLKLLGL